MSTWWTVCAERSKRRPFELEKPPDDGGFFVGLSDDGYGLKLTVSMVRKLFRCSVVASTSSASYWK